MLSMLAVRLYTSLQHPDTMLLSVQAQAVVLRLLCLQTLHWLPLAPTLATASAVLHRTAAWWACVPALVLPVAEALCQPGKLTCICTGLYLGCSTMLPTGDHEPFVHVV